MTSEHYDTQADMEYGSLLDSLTDPASWTGFIEKRESTSPKDPRNRGFKKLSTKPECMKVAEAIASGTYEFSTPVKKLVEKPGSSKKRTVYSFDEYEMMSLRVIAQLLYKYDGMFSDSLYSFRQGYGVSDAIRRLRGIENIDRMFVYKTDISNYFNSINTEILLRDLREALDDDRLYGMFESMLSGDEVLFNGKIEHEQRGVMAGTPVSPFLANFYLREVDECFVVQDCVYMRYADDILLMAESQEKLMGLRDELVAIIGAKGLSMNPKKERYFQPGEAFDFLGFSVSKDRIDLSGEAVDKIKRKIRKSSKDIRKWMLRKKAPVNGTVKALIRAYNRSFYGSESSEHTWCRWYFPQITTSETLHEVDGFFQEHIRYVATGRYGGRNHDTMPYELMRELGYRPLVHEYYSYLEGKS